MLVRLAGTQDCDDILEWRNDELTRKMSFEGGIVDYASHKAWFDRALLNEQRILVIGFDGENKIGIVRYDNNGNNIEVSVNLNPKMRGKGLASKLLIQSEKFIPEHWKSSNIVAEIKEDNIISKKTFERGGYFFARNDVSHECNVLVYEKQLF